jgi:uncharacterized protein YneR
MVFQIRRLTFQILIALIVLVFVAVIPVSATLTSGYYRVAPQIGQGATVFIGEQGLDISSAMAAANAVAPETSITTIGWWASAEDIYTIAPVVTIDVNGLEHSFLVNQPDFDGYGGEWYLYDESVFHAKAATGAVFNVKAPMIDLSIRDPDQNDGKDVSGTSIVKGSRLQFQIGTNMYTALANPSLRSPVFYTTGSGVNSDGYLDIRVRCENGTTLTTLYDDNSVERTLLALNVTTQPYTWGRNNGGSGPGIAYVWNTSTYPAGTYTVSVQSRLNNVLNNYLSGTAAYTGRTVSAAKTVTLVDGVPGSDALTQIAIFRPSTGYWYFDNNLDGVVDKSFRFGSNGDQIIKGNWQGTGRDGIAIFRPSSGYWYFDNNLDGTVDKSLRYGSNTDRITVGKWQGSLQDGIAIFRPSSGYWYFDYNLDGIVDKSFRFGSSTDRILKGNWQGTRDGIAIFRPSSGYWYFDYNLDGTVDKSFRFGSSTDQIIVGDWNGNGHDGIAIFRPSTGYWYFDYNLDGTVDKSLRYGSSTDRIIVGNWT